MFVPLSHPPGHAQCDFGEAWAVIGGVKRKIHFFVLSLPHSDGIFVKAYPAETTEAFCDGHVSAFRFLGGVPQSVLYDNTTLVVARILGDRSRRRTRVFTELQSHDGSSVFTFELRFSETPKDSFSYTTLRDHAFTVTGGEVIKARRLEPPGNVRWEITVGPSAVAVTIVLPVTTDCAAQGAICASDGRKLSNQVTLTISGPSG